MKKIETFTYLIMFAILVSCGNDAKQKNDNKTEKIVETENEISGSFTVNNKTSYIKWIGSKPAGSHNGTIAIKSGEMNFDNGMLATGEFTIDMTSINVEDLESGKGKEDLENHLKGTVEGKEDHFFDVNKYPTSSFAIKTVDKTDGKYILNGDLTIKGKSNPVEMVCMISVGADQKEIKLYCAPFKIDRTKWGIEFMSKSIFDDLKDKFIDDEIELEIMLKASKNA